MAFALEISTVARLATPIIQELYKGAKGAAKKSLNRWEAENLHEKMERLLSEIDEVKQYGVQMKAYPFASSIIPQNFLGAKASQSILAKFQI